MDDVGAVDTLTAHVIESVGKRKDKDIKGGVETEKSPVGPSQEGAGGDGGKASGDNNNAPWEGLSFAIVDSSGSMVSFIHLFFASCYLLLLTYP